MDADSQTSLRDRLFESAAVVLDIIKRLACSWDVDLRTLEEALRSLQDTLLGSLYISTPELDPFCLLCLQLCDAMSRQASHASQLADISVMGYDLDQLREVLLTLFHALSTYFNIIRCAPGKFDDNTKRRCMACIACSIRDLEKHQVHLNRLGESVSVLQQLHLTGTCLVMFYERLHEFGVDRYQQTECGCIGQGSNRMSSWMNDIVILRVGQDAMEHFAMFGELLLKEIRRRRGLEGDKILGDISRTYEDVEGRFRATVQDLQHGEELISYETLTRGYRLDFMGMSNASLRQLGWP